MDGESVFFGVIGTIVLLIAFFVGGTSGKISIRNDCTTFGQISINGEIYTCEKRE